MMVGTIGAVRGSSKKQRVAKAQLKELRVQTRLQQNQLEQQKQAQHTPPAAPPPGWYPSPTQPGSTPWWDGAQWTPSFAPAQ
jgi:type II secretory pathway pseudopilin PulG